MLRLPTATFAWAFAVCVAFSHGTKAAAEDTSPSASATQADITALREQIKKLRSDLTNAGIKSPPLIWTPPSGSPVIPYPEQFCPDGSYAAGVRAWGSESSTRYCIGCLTGVSVLCKPFPKD
jgi:hypothetical protein